MLTCTKCGRLLEETEFTFAKKNTSRNGRHGWCRDCCNEYNKQFRTSPEAKEKANARMRKYRSNPDNKQKQKARMLIKLMCEAGLLERPSRCPECGEETKVEAHHYLGYEPEHWADIKWLCRSCHNKERRQDGLSQE